MPLRIGIDARTLSLERPTGVERVAYHFIDSLQRSGRTDQEYVLYLDREEHPPAGFPGEIRVVPTRFPLFQRVADIWIAGQMRAAITRDRLDAFVSMNTKFPLKRRSSFTTVHGLEWYFCAREYRMLEKLKQWVWFQLCSRMSLGLVTFSEHTSADIQRLRPACKLPTRVVPEGVAPIFRRLDDAELDGAALEQIGVRGPFILSVCSHEPRKNLAGLIRAFAELLRERDLPHQLVLVGRSGWKSEQLGALIAELGLGERIVLPGYVPDETLVQAYNQAAVFVYPSKYEGFGLPLVEAMSCGAPLVTSARSSTAEVAGDAGVLVDPDSHEDIARGIGRLIDDDELRTTLIARGLVRAREFDWDEMTRRICGFIAERLASEEA